MDSSHALRPLVPCSALCEEGGAEGGECVDDGVGESDRGEEAGFAECGGVLAGGGLGDADAPGEFSGGAAVFDHLQAGGAGEPQEAGEGPGPLAAGGVGPPAVGAVDRIDQDRGQVGVDEGDRLTQQNAEGISRRPRPARWITWSRG
jgi:hypothetical protein